VSVLGFCEWLGATPGSIALHNSLYAYLIVSTVHVVTIALFAGTAAMLDLRLLGATLRDVPMSEVASRLRPWTVTGFLVMLLTGGLLFYANPVARYQNLFFRTKMLLLVLAGLNALVFHRQARRNGAEWDQDGRPPRRVRVAGGVALALWGGIILSGRLVAYDWFDCRRPQPALVSVLAGCVTDAR
jgi:hypothetical protein